jgi:hypothetical protein
VCGREEKNRKRKRIEIKEKKKEDTFGKTFHCMGVLLSFFPLLVDL